MRRFHVAIGVADIATAVPEYSSRLGAAPVVVVPGEYALWRTAVLNFSIRRVPTGEAGQLRHLGWEDPACATFTITTDGNGVPWEHFRADHQAAGIAAEWPGVDYQPGD
jgi:hypothetical protein